MRFILRVRYADGVNHVWNKWTLHEISKKGMAHGMERIRKMTENKWARLILVTAGVYAVMRFFLPLFYPFVLAALLVIPMYPWLLRVEKHTRIGKGFLTSGVLFFGGTVLVLLLWILAAWGSRYLTGLAAGLDTVGQRLVLLVTDCCEFVEGHTGLRADRLETVILERVDVFMEHTQVNVVPGLMKQSVGWFKWMLKLVAGIMMTFIGAVLLAKDYDCIKSALGKIKGYEKAARITGEIGHMVRTFLRAQFIIISCISLLAATALWIARVEHAVVFGILAGLLDALPFIGTGIVLMPLAFWQLLQGNYVQAAACVGIYTVCALLRELLEPKLIGGRMGLYPIAVLAAVYAGVKLYGLGGVILGPLSVLLVREILKEWE